MPELPEVERVRLSLIDHLIGRQIVDVSIHRAEVVEFGNVAARTKAAMQTALLRGLTIGELKRHGKQLAIVAGEVNGVEAEARVMCIHLGMTGAVVHERVALDHSDDGATPQPAGDKHIHLRWHLDSGGSFYFHDPRRFGGVWTFAKQGDLLTQRWAALGPDALVIQPEDLHARLHETDRHLKAALLDQSVVAGLGNIYVDELLFQIGLHPMTRASRVKLNDVHRMVEAMRDLLGRAIASGGSSLRNYVDGNGNAGAFQFSHQVYGRAGQPCRRCEATLKSKTVGGRTTVFCARCQRKT